MPPAFLAATAPFAASASSTFGGQCLASRPATSRAPPAAAVGASVRMSADLRKFLVGGNWKCNLDKASIASLVGTFNDAGSIDSDHVEVVVAPPSLYVESTRTALRDDFQIAAQNSWLGKGGAFTGEVSAEMVKDVGADWVILGHSERRHTPILKENDAQIAEKAAYAISNGLKVIYCIGELLEQREDGTTMDVCVKQLEALTAVLSEEDWANVVIAYEPVWAIGTGKVATPDQAEEVHLACRAWIAKSVGQDVADHVRILYGGSVSGGNCKDLAKLPDIDGFLVGGCSLKEEFLEIIDSHKVQEGAAV